jgi:ferredoxin
MRVAINPQLCRAHGQCYMLVPEVFEPDDNGYSRVYTAVVGPEFSDRVLAAVQLCPEEAISEVED